MLYMGKKVNWHELAVDPHLLNTVSTEKGGGIS